MNSTTRMDWTAYMYVGEFQLDEDTYKELIFPDLNYLSLIDECWSLARRVVQ